MDENRQTNTSDKQPKTFVKKTAKPHIHLHYLDCFANPRRTLAQVKEKYFLKNGKRVLCARFTLEF